MRTAEAKELLSELDSELAESSAKSGRTLSWTASEQEHLKMIGDTVDRRVHLQGLYANTDPTDFKNLCRLSTEIRLCDALVSRLLKCVSTDAPDLSARYESQETKRARHAARKRWNPSATG